MFLRYVSIVHIYHVTSERHDPRRSCKQTSHLNLADEILSNSKCSVFSCALLNLHARKL